MTPERRRQADQVEALYAWALTQLGADTVLDGLVLWQDVPPSGGSRFYQRWIERSLRLLRLRREQGTRLSLAYYRLVRALHTGRSIRLPGVDEGSTVTLDQLYDEFEDAVDEIAPDASSLPNSVIELDEFVSDGVVIEDARDRPGSIEIIEDGEDGIELDELSELEDAIELLEQVAEEQARNNLPLLGPNRLEQEIEEGLEPSEAHRKRGRRTASELARISMNAARGLDYSLAGVDRLVIGWVRVSTTGTPCGFCAMLISRDVYYKSRQSAQGADTSEPDESDKFHPNCACRAVPVFSAEQRRTSEIFAQNDELSALWRQFSEKYGDDMMRYWRKHFRRLQEEVAASLVDAA